MNKNSTVAFTNGHITCTISRRFASRYCPDPDIMSEVFTFEDIFEASLCDAVCSGLHTDDDEANRVISGLCDLQVKMEKAKGKGYIVKPLRFGARLLPKFAVFLKDMMVIQPSYQEDVENAMMAL